MASMNLGRHVPLASSLIFIEHNLLTIFHATRREAKIGNLYQKLLFFHGYQNILKFEIPMCDFLSMEVLCGIHYLFENLFFLRCGGCVFGEKVE
jgi:hypothetical protein